MLQQKPDAVVDVAVISNLPPVAADTTRPFLYCCPVWSPGKQEISGLWCCQIFSKIVSCSNINRETVLSSNHGHEHDFAPLPVHHKALTEALKEPGQTFFEHLSLSRWHISLQGCFIGCTINLLAVWSPVKPPVSSYWLTSQKIEKLLLVHFPWLSVIPLKQQHSSARISSYTQWGHTG